MSKEAIHILVTGEHEVSRFPEKLPNGVKLHWTSTPVLEFERIPVVQANVLALVDNPVDWIIFQSERAVRACSEMLLEYGYALPVETQVACIGERTAEIAGRDGFTPDFYPTEPGTEGFLLEFEDLISNNLTKPKICIPMAEGGRTVILERLKQLGCNVQPLPLYRTFPRKDIKTLLDEQTLKRADLILFTSPSSVEAVLDTTALPPGVAIVSLGSFTSSRLKDRGIEHRCLPGSDFHRISEILC